MKGLFCWVCLVVLVCAAGCSQRVQSADDDELKHPMMVKAKAFEKAGMIDSAIQIYKVLLEKNPDMARAHLGLAQLLDRPGNAGLRIVYHYQRYVELRPDTQKRKMIFGRIRAVTEALERENAALKVRNANLATQVARLQVVVGSLPARQVVAPRQTQAIPAPKVIPKVAPKVDQPPAVRTIRVQRQDTLRTIAARAYGDQNRWRDVYEANRSTLKMPEDVRVGQVLVIPE